MIICLNIKSALNLKLRDFSPDEDDVRSILIEACNKIPEGSEFSISGFGQDNWPVDIDPDLSIFLEQLPAALAAINCNLPASISFYEQGVDREISFEASGECCKITCVSWGEWTPNPSVELVLKEDLKFMLKGALDEFMAYFRYSLPQMVEHPWVQAWLKPL